MRNPHLKLKTAGMSSLEALIGATLLGFLVITFMTLDQISKKADSRLNYTTTIANIRGNIIELLQNRDAWVNTVTATANASASEKALRSPAVDVGCLQGWMGLAGQPVCNLAGADASRADTSDMPPPLPVFLSVGEGSYSNQPVWNYNTGKRPLVLARANGIQFYDSIPFTNGFGFDGQPCTGFDTVTGNDACPIHFEFSWSVECDPSVSCACPIIIVGARVIYSPQSESLKARLSGDQNGISPGIRIPLDPWCGTANMPSS